MKSSLLLRSLTWLAVFGGGGAAGYFLKPPAPAGLAVAAPQQPDLTAAPVPVAGKPQALPQVSFDGTPAGLLRLVKSAGNDERVSITLYLALQPLDAARIGALTTSFPWHPSMPGQETTVLNRLMEQWAEKDADAALRWAEGLSWPRSAEARLQILLRIVAADPDKALALARRITPAADRGDALLTLTNAIAEKNPRRAVEMLLAEHGHVIYGRLTEPLRRWAQHDPAAAFAKVRSLTNSQGRGEAAQAVIEVWAKTDPAAARDAALSLPDGPLRQNGLSIIFQAWAARNPAAARDAALKLGTDRDRQAALRSVISGWSTVDPAAAVQAAAALPRGTGQLPLYEAYSAWTRRDPAAAAASAAAQQIPKNQRHHLLSGIASAWAGDDPQAAMAWARSLPANEGGSAVISSTMYAFARADGPAAAALWQTLPAGEPRATSLQNLVNSWSQQNREAALQFARSLERPHDRAQALSGLASNMDIEKPEAFSAVLHDLPAGQIRVDAIRDVFANQIRQNPALAMQWLRTIPDNERTAVLSQGWTNMEYVDPHEMKALLESTPGLEENFGLWTHTATLLAGKDPAGALAWAQTLTFPLAQRQSSFLALQQWANEDPAAALAAAQALPDAEARKQVLPSIFAAWARQDADALLAWANTADGREREAALIQGTLTKADNDPAATAVTVTSLLAAKAGGNDGYLLTDAARKVAESWSRQDLSQAAAWAAQLPEGDARETAISTITSNWCRIDPVAASEWVEKMPPGDSRDGAAARLSMGIGFSDPERSFAWASSIANQSKRETAVRSIVSTWMWQDRDAARTAIQSAPVSENVRTDLLKQLDKRE